jgi:hypothetical protein
VAGSSAADLSRYRYLSTNILTGAIQGDWIPMVPQNCTRGINTVGTFTGGLSLAAGSARELRAWVAAMEPERSVLWVFQDSSPAWCGIIWDWPDMGRGDPPLLPISASTPESLFQKREISDDLVFTDADIFDIFRELAAYALSKQPNGQMAGFTMGSNQAGITASVTYNATDLKKVYDAWTDLISAYGFEYSVRPAVDASGNVYMALDLGFPEIGLPPESSRLAWSFPGALLDYRFPRTGSTSANRFTATASASGTLAALNAESDFEDGIGPWTGANGAAGTLVTSTDWSSSGTQSLSFHGNGSTANPLAQTERIPVTGGTAYGFSPTVFSEAGWAAAVLSIAWFSASGTLLSTTSAAAFAVAAATPVSNSVSGSAPASAVTAVAQVEMQGNPASSVLMLADDAVFATSSPTSGNWQSQLPHGQDSIALAAGYPLLEDSGSLSTVTVTAQSQIDAFADGVLPSVTGTQLLPLLILGAGQRPAVSEVVLGSYCQFSATSPLHPAGDDGSPGLQLTGRVTGWTLYPPSSQQVESAWLQLGQVIDLGGKYAAFTGASGVTVP